MIYEAVIGLEVHVQLKTATKAFCGCATEFGLPANTQTCPVCLGLPGTLPVLNKKFLEHGLRVALALNCTAANYLKFDRKNYFYPDLPKDYQISQYDKPLAVNGRLEIDTETGKKEIRILRVHMEEDAGKLIHSSSASLVDYNRCGMPLLEIVSEPDLNSAAETYEYLTQLKSILEYLEVSDCDMEKGSLRCDANISLRPKGETKLGVKTELKNMNSFKGVRDALNYEISRQEKQLRAGTAIVQETRLWNEEQQKTFTMRTKEEAHDYRYFPEPDLVPFTISDETIDAAIKALPELPQAKKQRLARDYTLSEYDAGVICADKHIALYFEEAAKHYSPAKNICNWLMGDIMNYINTHRIETKALKETLAVKNLIAMLELIDNNIISGKIAKEILPEIIKTGKDPEKIVQEKNLSQISDTSQLETFIDEVLREQAQVVNDVRSGKEKAMMFLVGQVMKKTRGKANPQMVNTIIKNKLETNS
ncbi:MAG: Asp-tRNA(Asn)/Glu-tRNA(Gln) amidotransferase subunit GatB [Candidatus Omnitrophica bacterium]|nr:Asp-tRNA(Asn)/Glu-tRNA(Gln) amidotransferase subunit GatB [Candidatus Omnitrophota bacterium]MBU4479608.1 Asp-tRNA(Asn)/Glu-tRNA(Gln) amidotransferase subunit GatB [Candidatus Omnitrophota bacterium]MCG2703407.1 Asp-tRNA(Asn)/Glu-tRNA(Gln) amidotransferase subunit GatB [Candidatus Omnitrophota bacterium]